MDLRINMEIIEKFIEAGQGQVFKYFEELSEGEKTNLLAQAENIDLNEIAQIANLIKNKTQDCEIDYSKLEAPFIIKNEYLGGDVSLWEKAKELGAEAIMNGQVACFVVAGGQGTRLGFDAPKGTFKASVLENKSLFEIFAQKILRASIKYNVSIPWLIMTSELNDAQTRQFFEENKYFGLAEKDVLFFKQGTLACMSEDGKILLDGKSSVAKSPDGHGGSLKAILKSGALDELKARGAKYLSYFQVDNPLVNILDEGFVGFHIMENSQVSSKMIEKTYASEKVGHFCIYEDKLNVIEYSDMPAEIQELKDENGKLKFLAGSVAIHIFSVDFIDEISKTGALMFHLAYKKIPYLDENGNKISTSVPNAYKAEKFIFDALPKAKKSIIIEGIRREEFSPIKNAEGIDSPASSKKDQVLKFQFWLKTLGIEITEDIEISPLVASNYEDFLDEFSTKTKEEILKCIKF